ncbi:MAG: Holliday junction resolvase RuvX [Pseudomonadota bacterium]|nr:Holliday junction resolvase RuvX [Pseudomonadota bacterium]
MAETATSSASRAGTILAFDFGTRRIGVAVGESEIGLAHPLVTIEGEASDRRFAAIAALIDEWHPALLIVGLPLHADGTEHAFTVRARRFAKQLEGRFGLAAKLVDERFTTHAATDALTEAGVKSRSHKPVRDQVAAQFILQAYFDQRALG